MLRQFNRRAHHYNSILPSNKNLFEWLSLMQHHGAPTRLLDFSHSQYIAAFFALEKTNTDSAIWAINLSKLEQMSAKKFSIKTQNKNIDDYNNEMIKIANNQISTNGDKIKNNPFSILHIEPNRLHERILNQQGLFLFPSNINGNIWDNLEQGDFSNVTQKSKMVGVNLANDLLIKFIIPQSMRRNTLRSLETMNISSRNLFPDLDGFARSMHSHISLFPGNKP